MITCRGYTRALSIGAEIEQCRQEIALLEADKSQKAANYCFNCDESEIELRGTGVRDADNIANPLIEHAEVNSMPTKHYDTTLFPDSLNSPLCGVISC